MSLIKKTPPAYGDFPYAYPLLIKQLLHTPLANSTDQKSFIVT